MGLEVLAWLRLWADKPAFDLQRLLHVSHTKSELIVLVSGRLRFILLISMLSSLFFDRVIAQTRIAQLKKLWTITKDVYGIYGWEVQCFNCGRNIENMKKGNGFDWNMALAVIKKIQTKKHVHYKTCVSK